MSSSCYGTFDEEAESNQDQVSGANGLAYDYSCNVDKQQKVPMLCKLLR
jgi:hypothetical protein